MQQFTGHSLVFIGTELSYFEKQVWNECYYEFYEPQVHSKEAKRYILYLDRVIKLKYNIRHFQRQYLEKILLDRPDVFNV